MYGFQGCWKLEDIENGWNMTLTDADYNINFEKSIYFINGLYSEICVHWKHLGPSKTFFYVRFPLYTGFNFFLNQKFE